MTSPGGDRPYLTCGEIADFLMDYLDGQVSADMRHEFERHLGVCPSCEAYIRSYKETVRLGRAAFRDLDEPAPGDVPEDLVKAILSALGKAR